MFEIAEPFDATSNPETVRPVRVPTLVMLGWKGWETTRATLEFATFPTRFDELRFEIAEPFDAISNPETVRPVSVPKLVMLGWKGWETTRATLEFATFPTRFDELMFEIAEPFDAISNPETVRPVSVPTLVMLGWKGWETTRATLEFATLPTRFDELMFEIAEALGAMSSPETVSVDTLEVPVTFKAKPKSDEEFKVVTLVVERLDVPATFTDRAEKVVTFSVAVFANKMFEVDAMFMAVAYTKGMVNVSKLKMVLVVFDVNPVVTIFVTFKSDTFAL
jgi:hypothetical protein